MKIDVAGNTIWKY